MTEPLISIVIPVKNGGKWLGSLLPRLMEQRLADRSEIIVIDSGSTDDSLDILREYPVRLISIPPESFSHGGTRNLGVRQARGKYVVLTVQDAVPAGDDWLDLLLEGFVDGDVAGVCGQQIVRRDKAMNPVQWFRPVSEPGISRYSFARPDDFLRLPPAEKRKICAFDNVNAMYLREALLKVPFQEIGFAEDIQWAKDALLNGYTIVFHYGARVYHYHYETKEYTYKRTFTELYYLYRILGYIGEDSSLLTALLRDARLLLRQKEMGIPARMRWWLYNYRVRTSYSKAIRDFKHSLAGGESQLDRMHQRICGVPPQAPKPISNLS
jgi:rhamnosyltransferase